MLFLLRHLMEREILDCDLHDFLEIACTFKILVEISMTSGESLIGTGITTKVDSNKREVLVFEQQADNKKIELVLTQLTKMKAIDSNPHFAEVLFK